MSPSLIELLIVVAPLLQALVSKAPDIADSITRLINALTDRDEASLRELVDHLQAQVDHHNQTADPKNPEPAESAQNGQKDQGGGAAPPSTRHNHRTPRRRQSPAD